MGPAVELEGGGVVPERLSQLPHLGEERDVRRARREHRLVTLQRALDVARLLEPFRRVLLVHLPIGELPREVEGPRGGALVPRLEEGVPEVQEDLRRDHLSQPDQAPTASIGAAIWSPNDCRCTAGM